MVVEKEAMLETREEVLKTPSRSSAMSSLVFLVPQVFRGKKLKFLAHLILVEMNLLLGVFCQGGSDLLHIHVSDVLHGLHVISNVVLLNGTLEQGQEVGVALHITSVTS